MQSEPDLFGTIWIRGHGQMFSGCISTAAAEKQEAAAAEDSNFIDLGVGERNSWGRSSVWLERCPVTAEVAGSSPVVPAIQNKALKLEWHP
jgi:hypothetical protein